MRRGFTPLAEASACTRVDMRAVTVPWCAFVRSSTCIRAPRCPDAHTRTRTRAANQDAAGDAPQRAHPHIHHDRVEFVPVSAVHPERRGDAQIQNTNTKYTCDTGQTRNKHAQEQTSPLLRRTSTHRNKPAHYCASHAACDRGRCDSHSMLKFPNTIARGGMRGGPRASAQRALRRCISFTRGTPTS